MKTKKTKKGFSIGEVMLAVFIVGTVLTVVSGLMGRALKTFFDSRDAVIAAGLSQEGVELVRNIRDNDFASGNDFGDGLGDTPGPKDYIIDRESNLSSASGSNEVLRFEKEKGYIHSGSGKQTEFSRRITISGSGDEREAISMVVWNDTRTFPTEDKCSLATRCVMTKSILANWKKEAI